MEDDSINEKCNEHNAPIHLSVCQQNTPYSITNTAQFLAAIPSADPKARKREAIASAVVHAYNDSPREVQGQRPWSGGQKAFWQSCAEFLLKYLVLL